MESNVSNSARKQEMFKIIEAYEQSGQTQRAFCKERELAFTTFLYWLRKYRKEKTKSASFIPLNILNRDSNSHYRIDLPNGIIIHLNGSEGLKLISELISHVCGK
ncbi:IS66 family insertion sequence element accessory protein TnpA [Calditrichota bacterium LG25]